MGVVTGLTKERMLAIEGASVTSGVVDGTGHLILTTHDGTQMDAGYVWGTVVDASATAKGIVELATSAESITGTDTTRAVTPAGLGSVAATLQPLDSDLTAIATLSPLDSDILQRVSGSWVNRTMSQLKTALGLVKADVSLGNVDNTSDVNKPVSTAQQTALNAKTDKSTLTTKGDLYVATASATPARLAVGSNGQMLVADSAQSTGTKWANAPIGATWWTRARSGIWYPLTGYGTVGGTSAAALVSNQEYAMPMAFGFAGNITGLSINKVDAVGNIRLGIRADSGDMSPGAVLFDSGAKGTAIGVIASTGITGVTVTPGVPLWFTVTSQGAGGQVTMQSIMHPFVGSVSSATPSATDFSDHQPGMYTQASISGALPGTFTIAGTGGNGSQASIVMKVQFGSITQGP